ncbi:hypothetical protein RD110_14855 [Rhodoferax koreense]|uniref:Uncharacterized protein n=1 Tax=Rhodoferax koreensis TaxID=1842727 RepID=A0A1P8JX26_9BURK|nr:hypothetical protein RD110_14855 [Rhodoferax koreense]
MRHIAVYVEEPRPKRFAWVLNESADGGVHWEMLQRAGKPVASYQEAMAGGLAALQELVDDVNLGPRGEPEVGAPAQKRGKADEASADAPEDDEAPAPAKKKAFFGFGPVR